MRKKSTELNALALKYSCSLWLSADNCCYFAFHFFISSRSLSHSLDSILINAPLRCAFLCWVLNHLNVFFRFCRKSNRYWLYELCSTIVFTNCKNTTIPTTIFHQIHINVFIHTPAVHAKPTTHKLKFKAMRLNAVCHSHCSTAAWYSL